jgi:hypothetical protein
MAAAPDARLRRLARHLAPRATRRPPAASGASRSGRRPVRIGIIGYGAIGAGRCDAFGVFGTSLPEEIDVFHSNSLKMVPIFPAA